MVRLLAIRKPNGAEFRRIQAILEQTADRQIQRRAEAILFYSAGLNAVEIAEALRVHPNTVYADLHAFDEQVSPVFGPCLAEVHRPALRMNNAPRLNASPSKSRVSSGCPTAGGP